MSLTTGSRLARNSVYNLLGQGTPFLAAVVAIPLLIHGLGTDRFGVLTLAWMVIGYFSLFDLGLGRALTQVVAERISADRTATAPPVVWAALGLMAALGFLGTITASLVTPWLVHSVLSVPVPLQDETLHAFYLLAAAIPLVVVTAGLVGILSAFQRFGTLNIIRAPMGIYTFVAPLAVLPFSQRLEWVIGVLVIGRLLACGTYLFACRAVMPPLHRGLTQQYEAIRPLFRFGAWMTVTNVIGPLMVYLDRFVIGATLSLAAVAYYATPYEMVTKLLIVPGAVLGVLFPAFAASYRQDHGRLVQLYVRGTKYIALMLFPFILLIVGFAHEGLQWWLGDEFARSSTPVLQALAIGVFINSLAQVLFTLVQGIGRPDLTAKLHMLEFPVYLPVLWWAIHRHGIVGASIVWTGRVAVDASLLFWLSSGFLGGNTGLLKRLGAGVLLAFGTLAMPLVVEGTIHRAALVFLGLAAFATLGWRVILAEDERSSILGWIRRLGTPQDIGDTSRIDQPWPEEDLEEVHRCPYCNSTKRMLAHRDVQDWSFYGAPGRWSYWACCRCRSLYLSPRPTPDTLAQAYATYYTHRVAGHAPLIERAKGRLRNEFWSHSLRKDLRPRLHLPSWLGWLLIPLRSRLAEPFQLIELAKLPAGKLVDVGCGSGDMLVVARQLGWQAIGLEVDPAAVRAARTRGVSVIEGSYTQLADFRGNVDCIICSHVLEHVYEPQDMLMKIAEALKPGGVLLLSLPNATSLLRQHFGNDWRGLEAPRHLTIPSIRQLASVLHQLGFSVRQWPNTSLSTAAESFRLRRRGALLTANDRAAASKLARGTFPSDREQYDFTEFACVKGPRAT